jgi:hypothetical protein
MVLRSPTSFRRSLARFAAAALALGSFALGSLTSCSLGETVSQSCDPEAPADAANACYLASTCDDGHGGIDSTQAGCCDECAVRTYERCVGKQIAVLSDFCGVNKDVSACCTAATSELASCQAGVTVDCDPATTHGDGSSVSSSASGGGAGGGGGGGGGGG